MKIKTLIKNKINHQYFQFFKTCIREFLNQKGYQEIDLPVLSPQLIPESYLEVFQTDYYFLDKKQKLYLTPSPELFLKRLLVFGIDNCFYLGKSFRNSELPSSLHSFEFEMLEIYKVGFNYLQLADEVLEMLGYVYKNLKSQISKLKTKNKDLNLIKNINFNRWEKITVAQAFEKYAKISPEKLFNHQLFLKKAKEKGYTIEDFSYEEVWSQIYTAEIEPHLGKNGYPTLIYDYPKEFAALAKLNIDGKTAQRFEFYINGVELGDCYTELTDWKEQEERFLKEEKIRKKLKKINHPIDKGFIKALKYKLPFCAGIAIGVERLAMVFGGFNSISDLKLIDINF